MTIGNDVSCILVRMVETAAVGSPHFSPILASIHNSYTPVQNTSVKSPSNYSTTPTIIGIKSNATPSTDDQSSDQGQISYDTSPGGGSHISEVAYYNGPTRLDFSDDTSRNPDLSFDEPSPVLPNPVSFGIMDDDYDSHSHDDLELVTEFVYASNPAISSTISIFRNPSHSLLNRHSSRSELARPDSTTGPLDTIRFADVVERLNECDTILPNILTDSMPSERSLSYTGSDAIILAGYCNTIVVDSEREASNVLFVT